MTPDPFEHVSPLEDLLDRLDFATVDELRSAAAHLAGGLNDLQDRGARAILLTVIDVLDTTADDHAIRIDTELATFINDDQP